MEVKIIQLISDWFGMGVNKIKIDRELELKLIIRLCLEN